MPCGKDHLINTQPSNFPLRGISSFQPIIRPSFLSHFLLLLLFLPSSPSSLFLPALILHPFFPFSFLFIPPSFVFFFFRHPFLPFLFLFFFLPFFFCNPSSNPPNLASSLLLSSVSFPFRPYLFSFFSSLLSFLSSLPFFFPLKFVRSLHAARRGFVFIFVTFLPSL